MAEYKVYPNIPQVEGLGSFNALEIPYEILPDEELPKHVLEGIARSQDDIAAGRFITFEEFKKKADLLK